MSTTVETSAPPAQSVGRLLGFIAYAAFITTMAQDKVLGDFPIRLWLKNQLHVDAPGVAAFAFWAGLAWYLKPILGLLVDAVPPPVAADAASARHCLLRQRGVCVLELPSEHVRSRRRY